MNVPLSIMLYSVAFLIAGFCLISLVSLICLTGKWIKEGCPRD